MSIGMGNLVSIRRQSFKEGFVLSDSPILYELNLAEMSPIAGISYENREDKRIKAASLRAQLESSLLSQITEKSTSLSLINNLTINHLDKYISSKIDSRYVNWFETSATHEDAKNFVQEYGADQVYFTQYLSKLAAIAPERAAIEIYSNLFEETGVNIHDQTSYDITSFHPEIFRRLCLHFDLPSIERFHSGEKFNKETYYCICMMLLCVRLGYLQGAGAMYVLESTIPGQLGKINNGLKRLGIPKDKRLFLEMHCKLDTTHAQRWWNYAIKEYLYTSENTSELLQGVDLALSGRNALWQGLLKNKN